MIALLSNLIGYELRVVYGGQTARGFLDTYHDDYIVLVWRDQNPNKYATVEMSTVIAIDAIDGFSVEKMSLDTARRTNK